MKSELMILSQFQCLDHIIERDFFPDLKKLRRDTGCLPAESARIGNDFFKFFYLEGFTSIPTALTANDRNRRIQVYQASDG